MGVGSGSFALLPIRAQKQQVETQKPDVFTTGEEESATRRLQFELVRLNTELAKTRDQLSVTERRLDQALRARARYKELWGRALNEVARLKQESEANTRQALQRKEAEIRNELERLQVIENNREGEVTAGPSNQTAVIQPNSVNQTQLARLLEERGALLTSGVYEEDDQLILDLDQEIRRLTGGLRPPSPPIPA
ncbi:unnamed protein product [Dibothriocephalus latus]|uniref:Uncharacterized protein n=1 Tax=Dibothriocephalus latus TaxID=60516 RepID=A0A3P7P1D3_DIBLA|nr:unnamed protein product [Dibothriocephalus latus]